jgi:26S proteasome regulatory subunit T5
MSSTQAPLSGSEPNRHGDKKKDDDPNKENKKTDGDAEMKDAEPAEEDILDDEILSLNTQDILTRRRLLENDSRIMKSEYQRLSHEKATMAEKIKENQDKIVNNKYAHSRVKLRTVGRCTYIYPGNSHISSATSSSS